MAFNSIVLVDGNSGEAPRRGVRCDATRAELVKISYLAMMDLFATHAARFNMGAMPVTATAGETISFPPGVFDLADCKIVEIKQPKDGIVLTGDDEGDE